MKKTNPVLLLILDGWGHTDETLNNAIAAANTPHYDRLLASYPHSLISGCGVDVGLPPGQMGNSEVGHLTLGSGRVIFQDLGRVSHAIETGDFFHNPALVNACKEVKSSHKTIHILGLLSNGGVHSHEDHLIAALKLALEQDVSHIYIHAFLDGRDTPPKSAHESLRKLCDWVSAHPNCQIATISGRYYAMDRDQRWDRVKLSYDAMVHGKAAFQATNAMEALDAAYARGETDEFVSPTCIHPQNQPPRIITSGDAIIYMNFRSDRARALSYAFTQSDFAGFDRGALPHLSAFVTLTEYDKKIRANVAFKPQTHPNVLGEYFETLGLKQLHIAETEKYAHVTFFFNGGREEPFKGEERILIPSPLVATYDEQPEMSAFLVTDQLINNIRERRSDFIICNFANADMVGHTGNFEAAVKAIEALDICIGRILSALEAVDGQALITADHGNAECMLDPLTQQAHTAHTTSLVPVIYFGEKPYRFINRAGTLSDVAPTILMLMGLEKPVEMTGHSLLRSI